MNKRLEKLDNFLELQKENEQKVILLLPFILIPFLVYYFIFPITDNLQNDVSMENNQINNKINDKRNQIFQKTAKINLLNAKYIQIESKLKKAKQTEFVMRNLMEEVKFLIFDFNRWSNIYNSIPKYIKNNNLLLLKLDNELFLNKITNKKNLVNLKMSISLDVIGDFKNVVKLIHEFEEKKYIVKVESFKTNGIKSYIKINIYGAEL
jgi:hypothetical protein